MTVTQSSLLGGQASAATEAVRQLKWIITVNYNTHSPPLHSRQWRRHGHETLGMSESSDTLICTKHHQHYTYYHIHCYCHHHTSTLCHFSSLVYHTSHTHTHIHTHTLVYNQHLWPGSRWLHTEQVMTTWHTPHNCHCQQTAPQDLWHWHLARYKLVYYYYYF